jgi:methionine-rich copper-binding protein CopC
VSLDRAVPAVGSTVHVPPTEVRIQYTEALEPAYSTARVEDAGGATVSTAAHVNPNEPSVLIVPLGPLKPGRYKVFWKVLSVDTHVTDGTFTFTVAP